MENDASLYFIITNLSDSTSGPATMWLYTSETGLAVEAYNNTTKTQKFIASQTGKVAAIIGFEGQAGRCKIDLYENGNGISRTKYFRW